jgi:hypothetical protein
MHKMDLEESAMKSVGRSERGFAQYGGQPARGYYVRGTHRLNLGRPPPVGIFSILTLDGK